MLHALLIAPLVAGLPLGARVAPGPNPALCAGSEESIERQLALMGTELAVAVTASDRRAALRASEAGVRALEATEARLSTWRTDTELARVNVAPVGDAVRLSAPLAAELEAAERWRRASHGAFDPTCGALVAAWDLRGEGRRPSPDELAVARADSGAGAFELEDGGTTVVRRRGGARFEEGGFGKGAGLDAALAALDGTTATAATFDLGGQLAWHGSADRHVVVAHPDHRARPAVALSAPADAVSVATSGNAIRGRVVDGEPLGHLLDPRTGLPAADFGSVTVVVDARVTGAALAADALSTACFVLGPDGALALAAELDGVEVLTLERDGDALRARTSAGLAGRIQPLDPEVRVADGDRPQAEEQPIPSRTPLRDSEPPATARVTRL